MFNEKELRLLFSAVEDKEEIISNQLKTFADEEFMVMVVEKQLLNDLKYKIASILNPEIEEDENSIFGTK